ncbi:MAG: hypothetical protein ABI206_03470 [Antricoccus sp.]
MLHRGLMGYDLTALVQFGHDPRGEPRPIGRVVVFLAPEYRVDHPTDEPLTIQTSPPDSPGTGREDLVIARSGADW